MDRLEFVKSIDFLENDFVKCAKQFFEQNMLLYNLVGKYSNIRIRGDSISPNEIGFSITFENINDRQQMETILNNNRIISLYGKNFDVIATNIYDNSIDLICKQV